MKKSIFSASKLSNLNVVAKGTKTTNDARPEVVTGRAINKFTMNASAAALLDVDNGDNVVMFYIPDAESLDESSLLLRVQLRMLNWLPVIKLLVFRKFSTLVILLFGAL